MTGTAAPQVNSTPGERQGGYAEQPARDRSAREYKTG